MKISDQFTDRIKSHEGYVSHSSSDSLGFRTIGYGFKLESLILTKDICNIILKQKLDDLLENLPLLIPWFRSMPYEVQEVLIEMAYQMGVTGLLSFPKTLDHLKNFEFKLAAAEMLESVWYKIQTPNRALRLSNIVAKCEED